ncbi:hypothetical protein EMIHUDRAFT_420303 [Emiliania huxleyi CCMP1516]|uniref:RING-type domain-containing protein n=2 Tax=Emiliania huxleyi TaxID=2903 RepID=A0A0D3JGW9_EMIH1|nr:hypothetical protein EMIHUDRAFT_420303 [Emiliania huxleyi CCMP1516]EOD22754.1 hypothetical protein EMIHUDRAFT_420303 [Emiliania huxleyi CCMP1516]|eukprot:XP_005775183.1 hypothetical protein EMIHUDRAFT_420303 [Emiliania huxleyi CCMP1516]
MPLHNPPQLLRGTLQVLCERPSLLPAAPGVLAGDEPPPSLSGCLVRFMAPFRRPGRPLYSAAAVVSLDASARTVCIRLLHEPTRVDLQSDPVTEVDIASVSNLPLTAEERLCASAEAEALGNGAPRIAAYLSSLEASDAYRETTRVLQSHPRCTRLEQFWYEQLAGQPEHELTDSSPPAHVSFGYPSLHGRIGEQLGGANLETSVRLLKAELANEPAARAAGLKGLFRHWPEPYRTRAQATVSFLLFDDRELHCYREYVNRLDAAGVTPENVARDNAGEYSLQGVVIRLLGPFMHEWTKQGKLLVPSRENLRCVSCLDSMEHGFESMLQCVWLQPCRHFLCVPCARRLKGDGQTKCPICNRTVLMWAVQKR